MSPDGACWYELDPDRADLERQLLEDAGLVVTVDHLADGRLRYRFPLPFGERTVDVRCEFPSHYPLAPPRFFAEPGLLDRHQDAREGLLCTPAAWRTHRHAVEIVAGMVAPLLADHAIGPDAVAAGELDMPEPRSATLRTDADHVLIVGDPLWADDVPDPGFGRAEFFEAAVRIVLTGADGYAGPVDKVALDAVVGPLRRRGLWVAIDTPASGETAADLYRRCRQHPAVRRALDRHLHARRSANRNRRALPVALTFVEEGPQRGEQRRTWMLLSVPRAGSLADVRLAPGQALTRDERAARTPELVGLADQSFVVVGAGSLGAPVTVELVKAGAGTVTVIDSDIYDVNNAARHLLPVAAAGRLKAHAVAAHARTINPFCVTTGVIAIVGKDADADAVYRQVAAHDVVIDTTGDPTVARILSRIARAEDTTLIVGGLTAGALGGDYVLLPPDGGCFQCFEARRDNGSIPSPPAGPPSNRTLIGCGHRRSPAPGSKPPSSRRTCAGPLSQRPHRPATRASTTTGLSSASAHRDGGETACSDPSMAARDVDERRNPVDHRYRVDGRRRHGCQLDGAGDRRSAARLRQR